MTEKEIIELADTTGVRASTNADLVAFVRRVVDSGSYRYRHGRALNQAEWRLSPFAADARKTDEAALTGAAAATARKTAAVASAEDGRSGYGDYIVHEAKAAYRRELEEAAKTVARAYPDYYDDLPENQHATEQTRIKVLSFLAGNSMTEYEALIYSIAAGLSYEEALEIADGAEKIRQSVNSRFEYYKYYMNQDVGE